MKRQRGPSDAQIVRGAAKLLREFADDIRRSSTIAGEWADDPGSAQDKAEHDNSLRYARELARIARYVAHSQSDLGDQS